MSNIEKLFTEIKDDASARMSLLLTADSVSFMAAMMEQAERFGLPFSLAEVEDYLQQQGHDCAWKGSCDFLFGNDEGFAVALG